MQKSPPDQVDPRLLCTRWNQKIPLIPALSFEIEAAKYSLPEDHILQNGNFQY